MQPPTETQTLYPQTVAAQFIDAFGDEDAVVTVNSDSILLRVRDATFIAQFAFDFLPVDAQVAVLETGFTRNQHGKLTDFCLRFSLQVPVASGAEVTLAPLNICAEHRASGDGIRTMLTLHWAGTPYKIAHACCRFETLLDKLAQQLPPGVYLRTCYNCLYSDYSPYGTSGFGAMTCHRGEKAAYLAVQTKDDYFDLRSTLRVQETYFCSEWEKRIKGTGYRG